MDRIFGAVLVMAVGLGFVLIIMATLGLGLFSSSHGAADGGSPLSLSSLAVSYVANVVIFALLFKYVPQATVRWRDVLPGALMTALLYFAGNAGVALYFVFSRSVLRYGAASFVLVLLFCGVRDSRCSCCSGRSSQKSTHCCTASPHQARQGHAACGGTANSAQTVECPKQSNAPRALLLLHPHVAE